jgi:hypothetical protein
MSVQQITLTATSFATLTNVSFVFSTAGSTTSSVPAGYTKVYVEAIGAGGQGFGSTTTTQRASGGGGGYARTNALSVTSPGTIYILVANTSIGATSSNSWVNISSNTAPTSAADGCLAVGGLSGAASTAGLGGGQAGNAGQIGTQVYTGATGSTSVNSNGGGAAGYDGNASGATAGADSTGITVLPMGGGTGGTYNASGGTEPGGGGGGASTVITYDGSIGRVRVTYVQ